MTGLSIRWRLTLWYGGVLTAVLVLFSIAVYVMMRHALLDRVDAILKGQAAKLLADVEQARDQQDLLARLERRSIGHKEYEYQVSRANGETLFRSERLGNSDLSKPQFDAPMERTLASAELDGLGPFRVITEPAIGPDGPLLLQTALSLASDDHEMKELLGVLLLVGPLAVIGALGGGYWLARGALAPVERMRTAADEITAHRLDRRIAIQSESDELGRLAQTLNKMIARLEQSFTEMQRFTADAAHELRTPLAVLRNEAEVALRSPRDTAEYQRVLENVLEEAERLSRLADQLLYLCREDVGLQAIGKMDVRLDELARDVAGHMQVVAQQKGINIDTQQLHPCTIQADAERLRRVIFNLLDNAIKYTPDGGKVAISSSGNGTGAVFAIADTGIGIAPVHLPRIFNRFYRVDQSRSNDDNRLSGTGLGLAICKAIIESHDGTVSVDSEISRGTVVTVRLPRENGTGTRH